MPVEFIPSSTPISLKGAINEFKSLLDDRPLAICLQGKSIKELEDRIDEFYEKRICWGAMNRFDIYQDYILEKVNLHLEVAMDVGQVKNVEEYEKCLRVPRWEDFLRRGKKNILITSEEILANIKRITTWDILEFHADQVIIIEKCNDIQVPNSIMLYLMILAKLNVKKIILFGFDGYGNPKAFKNTPIWDATEMECSKYINKTLTAYYEQDTVLEERRIGYGDERASDLHSNCPTYNDQFTKTYGLFCKENNLTPTEIVNCSPNALYTVHRKISYDQLAGEIE